jgi:HlyD family secretion protein
MMGNIRNHLGLIIGTIIIVTIIVIGFIPRPVLVDVAISKRDTLQVTIEEEGKTRVIDRYVLSAPVDGFARRLDLNVGDIVKKDQHILCLEALRSNVLDPRSRAEAEARISAATATLNAAGRNVRAADADAEFAASELDRLKRLYESRTISLDRFQQAEANARRTKANLESAKFDVQVAQFEKNAAEAALSFSAAEQTGEAPETVPILAPVAGSVLKIHHESEGVVNKGDPILEIGDPLSLEVEVDVLSRDAVKIAPGTRVLFERWGGDEVLEGLVRTIEPVGFTKVSALGVEEQRVLVIVDITSSKELWQRLGDGYRMETVFILWEGKDLLQIPSSALFRHNDGWSVFAVSDDRAELRSVKVGQRSGLSAEIIDGLNEGEYVINHPGSNVADNSRVRTN